LDLVFRKYVDGKVGAEEGKRARSRRKVIYVSALKLPVMDFYDYQLGLRLYKQDRERITAWNPSVIHTTVPDLLNLDLINLARRTSTPLISTFHSNYIKYMDYYESPWIKVVLEHWMRHMFSFVPVLYVPTRYYKGLMSRGDYHLDKCVDIRVWSRGVDTEYFRPGLREERTGGETFRERMGFKADDVVVTFVGRLVVEKNPRIFIQVLLKLKAAGYENVRGLLVGEGDWKKIAEEEGGGLITTTGWLKGKELVSAFASSDIFLFPSGCETFGNVTLEACSCGVPIVVESGCSSHLVEGNGFECKPNDVEGFYEATRKLVEDGGMRREMGKRSREEIAGRYKVGDVMEQMVGNYEEAITTQVGDKGSSVPRFEDNEFNFPWGRTEHPVVLNMIEAVFWVVVTSCVKGVQFYHFCSSFVAFRCALGAVNGAAKVVWGVTGKVLPQGGQKTGRKTGQMSASKRAYNWIGDALAWCILTPLADKPPIFKDDKRRKKDV
jgi:glycosyltransferase involved in cell wall biosynthesis